MDLTFLGPSAAVVIVVIFFLRFMTEDRKMKQETYDKLAHSIDEGVKASRATQVAITENSKLIRNLNGKLTQAIIDKHEENHS